MMMNMNMRRGPQRLPFSFSHFFLILIVLGSRLFRVESLLRTPITHTSSRCSISRTRGIEGFNSARGVQHQKRLRSTSKLGATVVDEVTHSTDDRDVDKSEINKLDREIRNLGKKN